MMMLGLGIAALLGVALLTAWLEAGRRAYWSGVERIGRLILKRAALLAERGLSLPAKDAAELARIRAALPKGWSLEQGG